MEPRTWRRIMAASVALLLLLSVGGAYVTQDVRMLLFLVPPSLTYFLLDAFRDAKHQTELLTKLQAKKEGRGGAVEAPASGKAASGDKATPRQGKGKGTPGRRSKAA
jgi:hypothetical protein